MNGVILVVLDGYGVGPPGPGNAVYLANPTNINSLLYSYPNTTLKASGSAVGLPAEEVGNTEVGHLNLGAGRIVYQDLPRINMSIAEGSFYKTKEFLQAIEHVKKNNSNLHIIGLIGEGSVHSSVEHLYALLYLCKENQIKNLLIHVITDGRDSPPKSGHESVKRLEEKLTTLGIGKIASVLGQYFSMDRDKRWGRTERSYACLTRGEGESFPTALAAISKAYEANKTDEFIDPSIIRNSEISQGNIVKGDAVIFFNYRIDRPRQLTKAFVLDNFEKDANKTISFDPYAVKYYRTHNPEEKIVAAPFNRGPKIQDLFFITMTEYEKDLPVNVAFPPIKVAVPLGKVLSEVGYHQIRMSESEKERFVTFYFNGQSDFIYDLEDRLIVPSPKVATYDLKPEMSAYELTSLVITKMRELKYRFILVNYANPDMVGHTGNIESTIRAIKTVDECMGKVVAEALVQDFTLLITADHGNAEAKINSQTGEISTEHTNNPVPFIAINNSLQGKFVKLQSGILADVAPTILALLGVPKPENMTGRNLLEEI